jgi:Type II secretion system (T2SS), protein M subtype b
MKPVPEKYHATAAVSAVLLFVIVLVSATLFTWSMIATKQAEIEARQTQLEALKRRAAQPAPASTTQARTVEPFFAEGFALAANELQQRVVGLIENAGGTLVTVGIDPQVTADDDSGRRVVVQAVAELSNDSLQQVLYQLESAAPFVFVENLLVSRIAPRGSSDAEQASPSTRLSVDLRAAGYFRRAAP